MYFQAHCCLLLLKHNEDEHKSKWCCNIYIYLHHIWECNHKMHPNLKLKSIVDIMPHIFLFLLVSFFNCRPFINFIYFFTSHNDFLFLFAEPQFKQFHHTWKRSKKLQTPQRIQKVCYAAIYVPFII